MSFFDRRLLYNTKKRKLKVQTPYRSSADAGKKKIRPFFITAMQIERTAIKS